MAIKIACVGRLKEPHYAAACGEYIKRLERYARVEVVEVKECSDRNIEVAKQKEARAIAEMADKPADSYKIALDRSGKQLTSEEFAELLKKPKLTFILGGPNGLGQGALAKADLVLSLSEMTLPHQLARVVLLEQVYRGFTIINREKYHK